MTNSNKFTQVISCVDNGAFVSRRHRWVTYTYKVRYYGVHSPPFCCIPLDLLLSGSLGLGGFLLVASNHDHADKGADDG
jgi:hypothetical protein